MAERGNKGCPLRRRRGRGRTGYCDQSIKDKGGGVEEEATPRGGPEKGGVSEGTGTNRRTSGGSDVAGEEMMKSEEQPTEEARGGGERPNKARTEQGRHRG
ncbi:hypothetical protein AMTR_s00005p00248790 [Amborella trichopoda]|uniref:Uncharacterized protein n=1 Tax=Amborella trichopoda TaxID=13333 RepID=W1PAF5_AMBTC|nr:hypothetical protein AMTR_s00005p00248790 [Amborella trichopoda]